MPEKEPRYRQWTATLWLHMAQTCLEQTMKNLTDTGKVRFIAYGEEVCPSTGALHYQAYLVFYQPQQRSRCTKLFGDGHHFEPMYGSLKQNEAYCSKEGSFKKLGDEPKQGERNDLIGVTRLIDAGDHLWDIAVDNEIHRSAVVKYHSGLQKYEAHVRERKRKAEGFKPPEVYIRHGEPCVSKTRYIYDRHGYNDVWVWNPSLGTFFDGYCGQRIAVFEDVQKGSIPQLSYLKQLLDGYPIRVNIKGGSAIWTPEIIYITSNELPCSWFDWDGSSAHYDALMSRVKNACSIKADGTYHVWHTSDRHAEAWASRSNV